MSDVQINETMMFGHVKRQLFSSSEPLAEGEHLPSANVRCASEICFKRHFSEIGEAKGFDIWNEALSNVPLPSLFKWCLCGPKWGLRFENKMYLKIFFSRTPWIRCLKFGM